MPCSVAPAGWAARRSASSPPGPSTIWPSALPTSWSGTAREPRHWRSPLGHFQANVLESGTIAVTGPEAAVTLNGEPAPQWESLPVEAGDVLACGVVRGPGFRLYLALAGGIAVPDAFGPVHAWHLRHFRPASRRSAP